MTIIFKIECYRDGLKLFKYVMFKRIFSACIPSTGATSAPYQKTADLPVPKEKMSVANFPHHPMTCGQDFQARLRMMAGIELNNDSVLTFRNQFLDYRKEASKNQGEMGAGGASIRAVMGAEFGKPDLDMLRNLREYAVKNGDFSPLPSQSTLLPSDFESVVIPIASSIHVQLACIENKMEAKEATSMIEEQRTSPLARDNFKFVGELSDWANGDLKALSQQTLGRLDVLEKHRSQQNSDAAFKNQMSVEPFLARGAAI
jgi:hypothetical protein